MPIMGHPEDVPGWHWKGNFYCSLDILGVYKASPARADLRGD